MDEVKNPEEEEKPEETIAKPEWLLENFWDDDKKEVKVETLGKSYAELRKEFNNKNNDKPGKIVEDYLTEDFLNSKEMENVEKEDEALKLAFDVARKSGLGVKAAQNFIVSFIKDLDNLPKNPIDTKAEMKKLGDQGKQIVLSAKNWVDSLLKENKIDIDAHSVLHELGTTARGIQTLSKIRDLTGEKPIPTGEAIKGMDTSKSIKDYYNMTYEKDAKPGESEEAYYKRIKELVRPMVENDPDNIDGSGFGI